MRETLENTSKQRKILPGGDANHPSTPLSSDACPSGKEQVSQAGFVEKRTSRDDNIYDKNV